MYPKCNASFFASELLGVSNIETISDLEGLVYLLYYVCFVIPPLIEGLLCDPSKGLGRVLARVPSETLARVTKRCMQGAL